MGFSKGPFGRFHGPRRGPLWGGGRERGADSRHNLMTSCCSFCSATKVSNPTTYIHICQVFQTNPNTLSFDKNGLFQLNYIFHYISIKKMLTKRKNIAPLLSLRRRRYITTMINHVTRPKIRRRLWVHHILKAENNQDVSHYYSIIF